MKYSKQILVLTSLAIAGCNSSEETQAIPDGEATVVTEATPAKISIADEHGHGPDADSSEGARSAAWQLVKQSEGFIQYGHDLEIVSTQRLPGDSPVWVVEYSWQHHGDPDGDYSGIVKVDNGAPSFVDSYGMYTPSCTAYEGDTIELQHDAYTWDRFTDMRTIDESGNLADPFPKHPMSGSYTRQGNHFAFLTEDGNTRGYYLVPLADAEYLLTDEEYDALMAGGDMARCALKRNENSAE